jgi:CDGSH-type Zn-finger protein
MTAKGPWVGKLSAGKYAICRCFKTATPPYCDGSHRGTGIKPEIIDLEEEKNVAICQCGKTAKSPYCDGSHAR